MDCDEGPGAHLVCQKGEPKGSWEDSWKALESLVDQGKMIFTIILHYKGSRVSVVTEKYGIAWYPWL